MDDAALRTLFATPPTDFVATRNALVKQLKQAKEREAATQVAAMRRPAWTDFALNVTSRDHGDEVEAFASAAEEVRDAQAAVIEGRDGPDVRDTLRALRERTSVLVELANAALDANGRASETPDLLGRLSDVAGNPQATERLRHGVLGSEADDDALNLFADLQPGPAAPKRHPAPQRADKRAPATVAPPKPIAPAAERRRRQREVDAAEGRLRRSRRAQREAEAEAQAASDAVAAAERTLRLAQNRLDKARSAAAEATAAVARDEAARDEALGAVEETVC